MTAKILTLYFNILRKMVLLTQQFSDNDKKLSAEGNQKSVYPEFSSSIKRCKIISDHTVIGGVLNNLFLDC